MPGSNYASVSLTGWDTAYRVRGYQFAYCTGVAAPVTAAQFFYESYASCTDATLIAPTAAFSIPGLPGSPNPGTGIGCWIVDIDLAGTTQQFFMMADGDGTWDSSPSMDNFGYAYMQVTPDPAAISGPIIAGDPDGLLHDGPAGTGCCVGCGTVFWQGSGVPGTSTQGSGLNNQDMFEVDDHLGGMTFAYNGCYWFGGYSASTAHADTHLKILADTCLCPIQPFCYGNAASGNVCPCANDNDGTSGGGCANSTFASGAILYGAGSPSVGSDSLLLEGYHGQPGNWGMFFQATNNLDQLGLFLGDGVRCTGGNLKRLLVAQNDASGYADTTGTSISARSAQLGYVIQPGNRLYYQWWYRDTAGSPCGFDSNSSNGVQVDWQP